MGFRPMRCSSVAKTSIGLPGCFAASSATAFASFFKCRRFFGRGRFRVLRTWLLDRPADRLQRFPAPLRDDRGEVARGHTISQVSGTTAYGERWIEQLLARYNAEGPEALGDLRRRNGAPATILKPDLLAKLRLRLDDPPPDGGLWSSRKVAAWMAGELTGSAAIGGILTIPQTALPTPRHSNDPNRRHVPKDTELMANNLSASQGRGNPFQ